MTFFDMVVSHGVFDSMPFDIAKLNVNRLSKAIKPDGYFYLDLISDDNTHPEGYEGEEVVKTTHEKNTIQSYFTMNKLNALIADSQFVLEEVIKKRSIDMLNDQYHSRLYVVLKKEV